MDSSYQDEFDEDDDSRLPILFNQRVHKEQIKGISDLKLNWKVITPKGRTTGVAIVMCVHLGIVPPDQTKLEECARKETWIDPQSMNLQKAKILIQENIIEQYNVWMGTFNKGRQTKAKQIKVELDPTKERLKKMCEKLRQNAKDERVIFHYNGHGVPRPPDKGEIWVFDKNQTQYLSVTLPEIMSYMKSPALYVWDCNRAGLIVEQFNEQARMRHKKQFEEGGAPNPPPDYTETCIHLAACSKTQDLPINPELPADLFTACLTTPVKTALHFWYHSQKGNKLQCGPWPEDFLDRIPGKLETRTTIMGELNWILTAVTDSIGFLTLDIDTFKKLFREDTMIACLFRNYLLADRVMRAYSVTPVSHPAIPSTANHPLWRAWDLTVDSILFELPDIISGRVLYKPSNFFKHQLTAFKVWLQYGKLDRNRPLQLPILLQMLMSVAHRTETLELIGKFLDLGPWAVEQGLGVGLFPYVHKLLSIKRPEHRHILVFIWAKIAACDSQVQKELLNDQGYTFFIGILENPEVSTLTKNMACFVLTILVRRYPKAQMLCLQNNLMSNCLMCLEDDHGAQPCLLWATLCLGHFWDRYDQARWQGVRGSAQEKVSKLLDHRHCEVRAAAVFALGTFLYTSADNSDHSVNIDQGVGQMLLKACDDGSTLVRQEVVVALCRFVQQFENNFIVVARTVIEESQKSSFSEDGDETATSPARAERIVLQSALLSPSTRMPGNVFTNAWKYLKRLQHDPYPDVRQLAAVVVKHIESKIVRSGMGSRKASESCIPGTEGSPEVKVNNVTSPLTYSTHFNTRRTMFGRGPSTGDEEEPPNHHNLCSDSTKLDDQILVSTQLTEWCATNFSRPLLKNLSPEEDPTSDIYIKKQDIFKENKKMKKQARSELGKRGFEKLDVQIFAVNNKHRPVCMDFHPYKPLLYVIDEKNYVSLWNYSDFQLKHKFECCSGRVKDALMLNAHYQPSLCVGNAEGQVFIFRDFDHEEKLVTAFRALGEINKRGTPLVMEYSNYNLFVSGNSKKMACWDLIKEKKKADIITQTDNYVTSLNIHDKPTDFLVMAGFNDGMARVYDLRTPPLDRTVLKFGGTSLNNKVVKVHVDPARENKFIVAYFNGEMSYWDYRKPSEAPHTMQVVDKNLTTMAFHNYAPVMASGSQDKYINVHNMWGDKLNLLKFHEGFMGQRMGPVKCLAFHPYEYKLASAGLDNIVSIYGTSPSK